MAARYYCVQWCHRMKGWLDLPSLASKSEKEATNNMIAFQAQEPRALAMRVIRKPHGWNPEPKSE